MKANQTTNEAAFIPNAPFINQGEQIIHLLQGIRHDNVQFRQDIALIRHDIARKYVDIVIFC